MASNIKNLISIFLLSAILYNNINCANPVSSSHNLIDAENSEKLAKEYSPELISQKDKEEKELSSFQKIKKFATEHRKKLIIGAAIAATIIALGFGGYQLKKKLNEEQSVNNLISQYTLVDNPKDKFMILGILYTTYYENNHHKDPSYLAKLNEKIGFNIETELEEYKKQPVPVPEKEPMTEQSVLETLKNINNQIRAHTDPWNIKAAYAAPLSEMSLDDYNNLTPDTKKRVNEILLRYSLSIPGQIIHPETIEEREKRLEANKYVL